MRLLYISHGAGPMPVLGDPDHQEMVDNLKHLAATMPRPSAILMISAHWEEAQPTVTSAAAPNMLFDYYGFPDESYALRYPAPGMPQLAGEVRDALVATGMNCRLDERRGFDHGMFIPLMLMYPEADIPCVQLSLVRGLNPDTHLDMGRALGKLKRENLLVVGSGFSFHNMRAFFTPDTDAIRAQNEAFDAWLQDTCCNADLDEEDRAMRLLQWKSAPNARYCHPREEHLMPLHVCYGAAGRACPEHFDMHIMHKKASAFRW